MDDWTIWGWFGALAAMVMAVMLRAHLRASTVRGGGAKERAMRVYRDQMAEVERDLARGVTAPGEAERLRLEISRRVLDLDREAAPAQTRSPPRLRALSLAALIAVIPSAGALYWVYGAPGYPDMPLAQRHADAERLRAERPLQATLEAEFAAMRPAPPASAERTELQDLVNRLRDVLERRPEDLTGHRLLAQNEARLGNFAAAAAAQAQMIEILGDEVTIGDLSALLDLQVLAAGGIVSPQAEATIESLLRRDPGNGLALYVSGRLYAQTGRPDQTFRIWRRLHDVSPGDAPWMPEIRAALPELAAISGAPRYQLPARPPPAAVMGGSGPDAQDLATAQALDPEARAQMVEGMVSQLASRLANEGGSANEWAQLIRALGVLERREDALAVWTEAQVIFGDVPEDIALIAGAAREVGVTARVPD